MNAADRLVTTVLVFACIAALLSMVGCTLEPRPDPDPDPRPKPEGNTYYVSLDGKNADRAGDIDNPFQSLNFALKVAEKGDIIKIRGGAYTMGEVWIRERDFKDSEPGVPLEISAFQDETVLFKFGSRRMIIGAHDIHLINLNFEMPWSLDAFGNGLWIEGCSFQGMQPRNGAITTGGSDINIRNNEIRLSEGGNTKDHGLYVKCLGNKSNNITIFDNTITGMSGYGVHVFDQRKECLISNITIVSNRISGSRIRRGVILDGWDGVDLDQVTIAHNIITDNKYGGVLVRNGSNIRVSNNVFCGNGLPVIEDKGGRAIVMDNDFCE